MRFRLARRVHPPGPRGAFFQGSDVAFRQAPLGYLRQVRDEFGDIVRLRTIWPFSWYFVSHPAYIEQVLSSEFDSFPKGPFGPLLGLATGPGLLALDGESWSRHRRILQPAFHRARIAELAPLISRVAEATADDLLARSARGESIPIASEMMRLALRIGGRMIVGDDLNEHADAIGRSMRAALDEIHGRLLYPVSWALPAPTVARRARMRAMRRLDVVVRDLIAARRRESVPRDDVLGLLLDARDAETGSPLTDAELHAELRTLLVSGHETSGAALAWCWLQLAMHRDVESRVHAEWERVLGGRTPGFADTALLGYTRMTIEETLRLFPPAPYFGRVAASEVNIGGYDLPAGTVVTFSAWVTHRHPDFWEAPDDFSPDRFAPALAARRPRFAYLAFSGGPRHCIGAQFAMLETAIVLATIGQRLTLSLAADAQPTPELLGTLHPSPGIRMMAAPRRAASARPLTTLARGAALSHGTPA